MVKLVSLGFEYHACLHSTVWTDLYPSCTNTVVNSHHECIERPPQSGCSYCIVGPPDLRMAMPAFLCSSNVQFRPCTPVASRSECAIVVVAGCQRSVYTHTGPRSVCDNTWPRLHPFCTTCLVKVPPLPVRRMFKRGCIWCDACAV